MKRWYENGNEAFQAMVDWVYRYRPIGVDVFTYSYWTAINNWTEPEGLPPHYMQNDLQRILTYANNTNIEERIIIARRTVGSDDKIVNDDLNLIHDESADRRLMTRVEQDMRHWKNIRNYRFHPYSHTKLYIFRGIKTVAWAGGINFTLTKADDLLRFFDEPEDIKFLTEYYDRMYEKSLTFNELRKILWPPEDDEPLLIENKIEKLKDKWKDIEYRVFFNGEVYNYRWNYKGLKIRVDCWKSKEIPTDNDGIIKNENLWDQIDNYVNSQMRQNKNYLSCKYPDMIQG